MNAYTAFSHFAGHHHMAKVQDAWDRMRHVMPHSVDVFKISMKEELDSYSKIEIEYMDDAKSVTVTGRGHLWDPASMLTKFGVAGTRAICSVHFTIEHFCELGYLRQLRTMFGRDYYERNAKFELYVVSDSLVELFMHYNNGDGTEGFRDTILRFGADGSTKISDEWPKAFE